MNQDATYFLATFWGIYLISSSLLLLSFPNIKTRIIYMIQIKTYKVLLGVALVILGLIHLNFHNSWTTGVDIIISIFGWMCLSKGILLMLFKSWDKLAESVFSSKSLIIVLLGTMCLGYYLIQSVNPIFKM